MILSMKPHDRGSARDLRIQLEEIMNNSGVNRKYCQCDTNVRFLAQRTRSVVRLASGHKER